MFRTSQSVDGAEIEGIINLHPFHTDPTRQVSGNRCSDREIMGIPRADFLAQGGWQDYGLA